VSSVRPKRKTFLELFEERAGIRREGSVRAPPEVQGAGPRTAAADVSFDSRAQKTEVVPSGAPPARPLADLVALRDAFVGVRPLAERDRWRVAPPPPGEARPLARGEMPDMRDADAAALERLGRLVAGGVDIDVTYEEGGYVWGLRRGQPQTVLDGLARGRARPDVEIDLHGLRGDDAAAEVVRFVRRAHRCGARLLRIVHGKGLHSEGGMPVLRDRTVDALSRGGAAPLVLAFVSAPEVQGGTGALLVRLVDRW
jgi:DNA-nicking Smr family endonuclease